MAVQSLVRLLAGVSLPPQSFAEVMAERARLIEQGSHSDLMAQGGKYANLYRTQANAYIRPHTETESQSMAKEG